MGGSWFDRARVLLVACALLAPLRAAAISFVPGHFYSTGYTTGPYLRDIIEYDADGRRLGALRLSPEIGDQLRGLAFGPDGLLYVVVVQSPGFVVLAIDHCGAVRATYRGDSYLAGNTFSGKLTIAGDDIYVAGWNDLTHFDRTRPGAGSVLYHHVNAGVFDAAVQPNGNLFVALDYAVLEITAAGEHVRWLDPPRPYFYSDVRGIEYDRAGDRLFVSQLGYSDFFDRVIRVDARTGAYEGDAAFSSPNDLFLTSRGELLVTGRNLPMRRYSRDLVPLGALGGGERFFVTEHPVSARCGDGALDPLEACDDHNRVSGDGCDAACAREPVHIGVTPMALTVVQQTAAPAVGAIRFSARDTAVASGAAGALDEAESVITIDYGNGASTGLFVLPACDARWRVNDGQQAIFAGASETTPPRSSEVANGKLVRFEARGLGDTRLSILGAADPERSVRISHCTTSAGAETCLCSTFPTCHWAKANGRARLTCANGIADPTCAAIGR
jgi:cysteine-rich repeat protein